jgi:hypothetical protein
MWDEGVLAKQVLSQLSYTPTVRLILNPYSKVLADGSFRLEATVSSISLGEEHGTLPGKSSKSTDRLMRFSHYGIVMALLPNTL